MYQRTPNVPSDPVDIIRYHQGTLAEFNNAWQTVAAQAVSGASEDLRKITSDLLARIADTRNLRLAWLYLRVHGGPAPGPDGIRYGDLGTAEQWELLRQTNDALQKGIYRPARPKLVTQSKGHGRGTRTITLFNIADRVVQRAIVQILQPLIDPTFDPRSFGSRPRRGTFTALATLDALLLKSGKRFVVVNDIVSAYDSVPRNRLLDLLKLRIPDPRVIDLVQCILNTVRARQGIPQGGPLSALLMNIYLDHFLDRPWRERHPERPLLRYVDDLLVLADSEDECAVIDQDLERLLTPAAMRLKMDAKEAAFELGVGKPEWLGFQINFEGTSVKYRLPTTWGRDFRESLVECHDYPNSVRRANAVIRAKLEQAAPALRDCDMDAVLASVTLASHACGFKEIPADNVMAEYGKLAVARWTRSLRHARRQEEIVDSGQIDAAQHIRQHPEIGLLGKGSFELFTDGCCLAPNGPGGWACIVRTPADKGLTTLSGCLRKTTNNRAELLAVINGVLRTAPGSTVHVVSDSEYVCNAINGWLARWKARDWRTATGKPVKNQDLWEKLDALLSDRHVTCGWVRGHSGHHENELADQVALRAAERMRSKVSQRNPKSTPRDL